MLPAFLLLVSLGLILAAAELFTNAVEWTGQKLSLNEGVVGSILAAVGTAMPETLIPMVAVLFIGGDHGHDVGIGAILGAPFMLSTLALFVTGFAVLYFARAGRRTPELQVNSRVLGRDIRFFLVGYLIAIAAAFVPAALLPVKVVMALGMLALYAFYVYRHATDAGEAVTMDGMSPLEAMEDVAEDHEQLAPLRLQPRAKDPRMVIVVVQLVVSLAIMMGGAYLFVDAVNVVAFALGVPTLILSLLIAPLATELPEKFNSVLWVRQGKDTLALGNITGAMVFQSCIPAAFGIIFSDWALGPDSIPAFMSGGIAVVAAAAIFGSLNFGRKLTATSLLSGGLFYLAYVTYVLFAGGLAPA